jgi:quercetin dioxygenase-like cupin family protein
MRQSGRAMTSHLETDLQPKPCKAFIRSTADVRLEGEDHPTHGNVVWRTLISGDRTPSNGLVLGVADVGPGGWLGLHRHDPAEFYLGLSGEGTATVDGQAFLIKAGVALFIPGNAEHGITAGPEGLSFAYGFAANAFDEIEYRYTEDEAETSRPQPHKALTRNPQ